METLYKESNALQNAKYDKLTEKLDQLTTKFYAVEKENSKLKIRSVMSIIFLKIF